MTKTHIYTALLMGSRFFIHRQAFVKLHGRCKYSAQQKICPRKTMGRIRLIKNPRAFRCGENFI